jgi:hypothetical protein
MLIQADILHVPMIRTMMITVQGILALAAAGEVAAQVEGEEMIVLPRHQRVTLWNALQRCPV